MHLQYNKYILDKGDMNMLLNKQSSGRWNRQQIPVHGASPWHEAFGNWFGAQS